MIQRIAPGAYNYIAFSKSDNGQKATGSSQCKKYLPYTSKRFFVCIDSDLEYLKEVTSLNPDNFVAQTYTYSWENHYVFASELQNRLNKLLPVNVCDFDFQPFLSDYSDIVYRPLLALLFCIRTNNKAISQQAFNACLHHQCSSNDLKNNGKGILQKIKLDLDALLNQSGVLNQIDFRSEEERYNKLGLNSQNAYLHVRGHNLYDLLKSIGKQICSKHQIDFENDILNRSLPNNDAYWEIERVTHDLQQILS